MWQCYYCRVSISLEVQKKNRLCPSCGSDMHCCKNCEHFDENSSSKCKEPNSPWVHDRESQNNCPFFEMKDHSKVTSIENQEALSEAEKAKEAFKALFRNA
jgi:hypothetical protein